MKTCYTMIDWHFGSMQSKRALLCLALTICFVFCPLSSYSASAEQSIVSTVSKEPITKQDFVYDDSDEGTSYALNIEKDSYLCYGMSNDGGYNKGASTIITNRGIRLHDTLEFVLNKYDNTDILPYDYSSDHVFEYLDAGSSVVKDIFKTCEYYIFYTLYDDPAQIIFYFDDNERLLMICYAHYIIYDGTIAQKGSKGNLVQKIQKELIAQGFLHDSADGIYGNNTVAAVKTFQVVNGLSDTGIICGKDYDALFKIDWATKLSSQNNPANPTPKKTKTYQAYTKAMNLTTADLTMVELLDGLYGWAYNGLPLLQRDQEDIAAGQRIKGDAIYRKIAMCIEGYSIGNDWESYAPFLVKNVPDSREGFDRYIENAKSFIVTENPVECVLAKLQRLNNMVLVEKTEKFVSITIRNVTNCANAMQISTEMLGYILAMLSENGASIEFYNYACRIDISMDSISQHPTLTLDALYENVKIKLNSSECTFSDIVDSSEGQYMFAVNTEKYGESIFTVLVDHNGAVTSIAIAPGRVPTEQASNYIYGLARYISAIDRTMDTYDGLYMVTQCRDTSVEKNGFSYHLDYTGDFVLYVERK